MGEALWCGMAHHQAGSGLDVVFEPTTDPLGGADFRRSGDQTRQSLPGSSRIKDEI